jgi:DNA-binding GntR family transcriptional regulator
MTETGDRGGPASHHPGETGDHPSATVRQPVMRPRGTYVSKSDMVTDAVRDLITDGLLSPGTPLRQRELAEWFAVSYTPVREALRRLESEGLVVTDVHRGATVARPE